MLTKIGILGLGLGTLMLLVFPVGATNVGIIDTQNGWTVDYSLTYVVEGDHYDAALTINTSTAPGPIVNGPWKISDVAFKFYDGEPAISITPEGTNAGSMTAWNPHDGFYGFKIGGGFPGGFLIDGSSITFDFDFDSGVLVAKDAPINFFVDYTGAWKGNTNAPLNAQYYQTNLSSYLVPEPGTALLLGSGLLGLFAFGRSRLKK